MTDARTRFARSAAVTAAVLIAATLMSAAPTAARADPSAAALPGPAVAPDGKFPISPDHSPYSCLDLPEGSDADSVRLVQWTCNGQTNQYWYFVEVPGFSRVYTIRSAKTDKCFQVAGLSIDSGAPVQQYRCVGGANERWTLHRYTVGPSYRYQIRNVNSGKCLNVAEASKSNGAAIIQWPCGDPSPSLNERWFLATL